MRLWSIHPRYLDAKGLVALWREALLAQAVLSGLTRGYTRHPQLQRFREQADARGMIAAYLHEVAVEAERRGYRFDVTRIAAARAGGTIELSTGQLRFEWQHLRSKLLVRDPVRLQSYEAVHEPLAHPLFSLIEGPVASWERDQKT